MHKITLPLESPQHLTQAVLQVITLLGMYQAELARILGLQCADIGAMASAQKVIDINSEAGERAVLLVKFFNLLYDRCLGDEVKMCHWLRRYDKDLSASPFYLIVDEHKLENIITFLEET
ncbi:MAG: hypothetical protein OQK76_05535 [Gammaproteobacteria bacterium]|nr:hypothetical protein [Gammaproteobacteria bacterium]MCW8910066.1 hypothetical protein [Gammaproteobacteria bacterium]MCW9004818.1 hypothetical protein [Gammaproteobacteria bacterium]MCW9055176.1 hypothetical protein [Gammaproteobacteria bacterium]